MFQRQLNEHRVQAEPADTTRQRRYRCKVSRAVFAAAALVLAGCSSEPSAAPAPSTTAAPVPELSAGEILAAGPSAASSSESRVIDDLLRDLDSLPGVTIRGRFPNLDQGNLDYGYPPAPCTPAQRLRADELGAHDISDEGFRLDDESGSGGVRVLWFDSATDAGAYMAAFDSTCADYETVQQEGSESPRGIRRTMSVETGVQVNESVGEVSILSSTWRATLNDRGWGNDVLHAVQLDNLVVEAVLVSGLLPEEIRADAEAQFLAAVDHVEGQIGG